MTFTPRAQRIQSLAHRAFERHRAAGAIQAGIAAIEATFGENRRINDRKLAVERAMRRGVGDVETRFHYRFVSLMCTAYLETSICEIERSYRAEIREREQRRRFGLPLPSPVREERLGHARLFLRWYRRFGDRKQHPFFWLVDAMTTSAAYRVHAIEAAE